MMSRPAVFFTFVVPPLGGWRAGRLKAELQT